MEDDPNPNPPTRSPRPGLDLGIEGLRGLAIILMVTGHVIGSRKSGGLQVPDTSMLRWLYLAIDPLAMPLFAVMAGYVYALKPPTGLSRLGAFVKAKLLRIGLPLVTATLLTYVSQRYVLKHELFGWDQIYRLWFFQYQHFWFIQALLTIFLLLGLLDALHTMRNLPRLGVVISIAFFFNYQRPLPQLFLDNPDLLCLIQIYIILPFVLLGLALNRFGDVLMTPRVVAGVAVVALGILIAYQTRLIQTPIETLNDPTLLGYSSPLGIATSVPLVWALLAIRRLARPLAWLGGWAFAIYLFHLFGVAMARMVLNKAGVTDVSFNLIGGIIAGLLLPTLAGMLIRRSSLGRLLFLGERARKRPASTPPRPPAAPAPVAN